METEEGRDPATGRILPGYSPDRSQADPERKAVIVALADVVGTRQAAAASDVPRRTLRRWGAEDEQPESRALAREVLADEAEKIVKQYMEHLKLPAVAAGASARDAATVVGILVDKAIKLRGEDKPNPLETPMTIRDYFLALAAEAAGAAKARAE